MANVEKISVALTPEMAATMRRLVASGEYASASEVMREAPRDWQFRRTQREQAVAELGRLWDRESRAVRRATAMRLSPASERGWITRRRTAIPGDVPPQTGSRG